MKKIYDQYLKEELNELDLTKGFIDISTLNEEMVGRYVPYSETELRNIQIEERLKILNDWFVNYQSEVIKYERETRIQDMSPQVVLAELQKIDSTKNLNDLLGSSTNILKLEINACLYSKEKAELEAELKELYK